VEDGVVIVGDVMADGVLLLLRGSTCEWLPGASMGRCGGNLGRLVWKLSRCWCERVLRGV